MSRIRPFNERRELTRIMTRYCSKEGCDLRQLTLTARGADSGERGPRVGLCGRWMGVDTGPRLESAWVNVQGAAQSEPSQGPQQGNLQLVPF